MQLIIFTISLLFAIFLGILLIPMVIYLTIYPKIPIKYIKEFYQNWLNKHE